MSAGRSRLAAHPQGTPAVLVMGPVRTHIFYKGRPSPAVNCRPPAPGFDRARTLEAEKPRGGDPPAFRAGYKRVHTAFAGITFQGIKYRFFCSITDDSVLFLFYILNQQPRHSRIRRTPAFCLSGKEESICLFRRRSKCAMIFKNGNRRE